MGRKISKTVTLGAALGLLGGGLLSSGFADASSPDDSGSENGPGGANNPLAGTAWELQTVIDEGELTADLPAESTLSFDYDGRVGVAPGCNTGGGSVEVGDEFLTVNGLVLTMMACEAPIMDLEHQVVSTLDDGAVSFDIDGDVLMLTDDERTLLYENAEQ